MTQVIYQLVATMTKKEMQKVRDLGTIVSEINIVRGLNIPKYDPGGVKGEIHPIRNL